MGEFYVLCRDIYVYVCLHCIVYNLDSKFQVLRVSFLPIYLSLACTIKCQAYSYRLCV